MHHPLPLCSNESKRYVYSKASSSSTERPACLRMWESVDRLIGRCAGTMILSVSVGGPFLKPYVTAPLANDHPIIPPEGTNDLGVRQTWYLAHTAISICSASGLKEGSSSAGSRYSSMASRILRRASSLVFPSLMQPGRAGTVTVYPPSSLGSRMTRSLIPHLHYRAYPANTVCANPVSKARSLASLAENAACQNHDVG